MLTIKLAITKLILSTTIHIAPAPVEAHAYTATVDTATILAGLDAATAKIGGAK